MPRTSRLPGPPWSGARRARRPAAPGRRSCAASSRGLSRELREEAQIAVEEQTQVFDAVAKHGQPLEARAEGKADVALRVEAEVVHHRRMHLPGAGDLEPAALQLHVDLGRRLGKR